MSTQMKDFAELENAELFRSGEKHVTFEEFITQGDEDVLSEWIDGQVITMAAASSKHQLLTSFLEAILKFYVETHQLGVVIRAPFPMKLMKQRRGREPDILSVSNERAHLIKKTHLNGAADLVIEAISPESIGRDRGEKFVEYEAAGIKEYWLIDHERESAEFYELGADGRYHLAVLLDEIYHSKIVKGFFVRTAWLWQEPNPTIEAMRELKII